MALKTPQRRIYRNLAASICVSTPFFQEPDASSLQRVPWQFVEIHRQTQRRHAQYRFPRRFAQACPEPYRFGDGCAIDIPVVIRRPNNFLEWASFHARQVWLASKGTFATHFTTPQVSRLSSQTCWPARYEYHGVDAEARGITGVICAISTKRNHYNAR